jgi:RNA polymerase sigma-70 factor, ECF subfamily
VNAAAATEAEATRTDESLIEAARGGDGRAKALLFRRYAAVANHLAYRLLGRDDELDDVVQQSFVTVFEQLSRLSEPLAFRAWLTSIVTRTTIATIRRRRLLWRLGFVSADRVQIENILANDAPPDVLAELELVYLALDAMPAVERVVLVLRCIEQLSLEEIASQTCLSLATVKRRLARAEQRLKLRMREKGVRA